MSSEETAQVEQEAEAEQPEKESEAAPENAEAKEEANTTVHVGNLSWQVTEERLKEVFEECGKVLEVRIPLNDRDQSKGFGFVKFENPEDCQKAIEKFNEKDIDGRAVRVEISDGTRRNRGDRRDGGRDGGRYGGRRYNDDRRGGDRYSDRYNDRRGGDRRGGDRYESRRRNDY